MVKRAFRRYSFLAAAALVVVRSAGAAPSDAAPPLENAQVTAPYSEIKNLWAAAQRPPQREPEPPVDAALLSARYQLALKDGQVAGVAEFETEAFTDKWTVVPLLGTEAQIDSVEPADVQLILRQDHYAVITNKKGKQDIKIRFCARLAPSADGTRLGLEVAPALINTLSVSGIPGEQALEVADAIRIAGDKGSATFRLAVRDRLELNLVPEESAAAAVPSKWKAEPQIFVRFADGKLLYEARIALDAAGRSGLGIDLELPPDASIADVAGSDLAGWRLDLGEKQSRVVRVRWKTRDILRRELAVFYDLPQPLTAAVWNLQSPRVIGGSSSPPLYLLALQPGLELTPAVLSPVPRQLPRWLAEHAENSSVLALAGEPPLQAKWLLLVQTTRALVEDAQATMQVVNDGAALVRLDYSLRHEAAFGWRLNLPEGSELLACSVDDRPLDPINRGEHVIEFPLPAGKTLDEVKISYTAKLPAFKPLSGKIDITLPQTELLTNKLEWELQIPAEYEVAAFEGNVQAEAGAGRASGVGRFVKLHREIFKSESPSAELFYQKPQTNK